MDIKSKNMDINMKINTKYGYKIPKYGSKYNEKIF